MTFPSIQDELMWLKERVELYQVNTDMREKRLNRISEIERELKQVREPP